MRRFGNARLNAGGLAIGATSLSARNTITWSPYGLLRMTRVTPPTWFARIALRRCGAGETYHRALGSSTSTSNRQERDTRIEIHITYRHS